MVVTLSISSNTENIKHQNLLQLDTGGGVGGHAAVQLHAGVDLDRVEEVGLGLAGWRV